MSLRSHLLPALVMMIPLRKVPQPLGVSGFIAKISQLVARKRGSLLIALGVFLILLTLALLPLNKVDFNRFSFIDKDSDFHHAFVALSEKIGNDQNLVYSIHSGNYYGITEPAYLQEIETFSLWLETQPEASSVRSYTDLLKTMNSAEHDGDESWEILPDDNLQIIDYLVSYQLVQELEPHLEPLFNSDYSAIRLEIGTPTCRTCSCRHSTIRSKPGLPTT